MTSKIDFENTIVKYVIRQGSVPYVGELRAIVEISRKPIFKNYNSIDVIFLKSFESDAKSHETNKFLSVGSSSISYRSVDLKDYRNRINLSLILPCSCAKDRTLPFDSARTAAKRFLPDVIAEYELIHLK